MVNADSRALIPTATAVILHPGYHSLQPQVLPSTLRTPPYQDYTLVLHTDTAIVATGYHILYSYSSIWDLDLRQLLWLQLWCNSHLVLVVPSKAITATIPYSRSRISFLLPPATTCPHLPKNLILLLHDQLLVPPSSHQIYGATTAILVADITGGSNSCGADTPTNYEQ